MRASTLARLSLVALVAATFLAIFYAQELKREKKLLLRPYPGVEMFEPGGGGKAVSGFDEEAHFSVRASVPDTLEVSIVSERTHRTVFVTNVRVREYRSVPVTWDGRTAAGTPAPPGDYRLSIHFRDRDRTVQATLTLDLLRPPG